MPPIRRLALTLLLPACRVEWGPPATATAPEAAGPRTLWLYTSLYQEVVDDLKPRVEAAFERGMTTAAEQGDAAGEWISAGGRARRRLPVCLPVAMFMPMGSN